MVAFGVLPQTFGKAGGGPINVNLAVCECSLGS